MRSQSTRLSLSLRPGARAFVTSTARVLLLPLLAASVVATTSACKKRTFNSQASSVDASNEANFGLVLHATASGSFRVESARCAEASLLPKAPQAYLYFCAPDGRGWFKAIMADYAATVMNQTRWTLGFALNDALQFLNNAITALATDPSELAQLEKDVNKIDTQQLLEFSEFNPAFEAQLLGVAESCKGKESQNAGDAPPVTVTNAWRETRSGLMKNEEFAAMRGKEESERAWFVGQLCSWFAGTSAFARKAVWNAVQGGKVALQPTDDRALLSSFWTLNKWANSGALQLLTLRTLQLRDAADPKRFGVTMENFVAVVNPRNEIEAISVLGSKRFPAVLYVEYIATNPKNLSSDGPNDKVYGAISAVRHLMRFIAVDAAFARADDPTLENIVVKPVPMLRSLYERLGFKETSAPYVCRQVTDAASGQSFCQYLKKMRDSQLNLPPGVQTKRGLHEVPNGYVMHLSIDDAARKLGLVIKSDGSVLTGAEAETFRNQQLNNDVRRSIQ